MAKDVVQFGNPDFWQEAYDSFPRFWAVIHRAADALNNVTMKRVYENVEPHQKVILNLGLLSAVSVMELITLVGNGFGLGAMKVARTLLESAINAEYLRMFSEECDNYLEWHWVEQYKMLEYMRQHMPKEFAQLRSENIDETKAGFDRARNRYLRRDGSLMGSWCRLDLGARSAKVGFEEPYKLVYPMGSKLIHGTFGGLAMHFDADAEESRIGMPPSPKYCAQALVGAHGCLIRIVETVSKTFGVTSSPSVQELLADYESVWRDSDLSSN